VRAPLKPLGYQPALDGVRAVAIALVVLFHTDRGGHLPVLPGGFLGVDVFFVLSGFRITSLLLDERAGTGRIRMRAFWGRRVARLFPLLWALLAVNAFAAWVHPIAGLAPPSPLGFLGLLGYVGNWVPALGHGGLFGLEYVWSLSVEEQFYVVWPLVVAELLALAAGRRRPERSERSGSTAGQASTARTPPVSVAAVALGAAVLVMVLRPTVFAHTFFFFNTLLRADALLLGAALAATRHLWQPRISPALSKLLIAAAALVIVVAVADTGNLDPSLPTWKLPALEVAVVVLGAALVAAPATSIGRLAGSNPLVWLGRRSYAIYLVHLPLFGILEARLGADRPRLRAVVEIPAALCWPTWPTCSWSCPPSASCAESFMPSTARRTTLLPLLSRRW